MYNMTDDREEEEQYILYKKIKKMTLEVSTHVQS